MKKINLLLILTVSLFAFFGCEKNEDIIAISEIDYVTFGNSAYSAGVDPGGTANVDVPVFVSNISSADRSFNVSVDPSSDAAAGSYDMPATVAIPSGTNAGMLTVALSDVNLGIGVNNLVINLDLADGQFNGGSTTISYVQNCTEVTATLEITFDAYPEESGWYIEDALGGIVASAAAGDYAGQASATESIVLCSGRDYTFVFTDSWGDGTAGSYSLTVGGTEKASGGNSGNFTSDPTAFDTN